MPLASNAAKIAFAFQRGEIGAHLSLKRIAWSRRARRRITGVAQPLSTM
ncbi:hypothetical protein KCP73_10535 [Salmonella enterica subsp. enterica]|nr:hypothetical protein KCP73_10535 [Salmonella enterica subsp. enterica]